jgi:hypothetical protein
MKPKTKLQQRVYELSQTISPLTETQRKWALNNCLLHIGYRTKKHIACLDCGHRWNGPQKVKHCVCPSCQTTIKIEDSRKLKLNQNKYLTIVDAVDTFQVVRFFEVFSYHKAGTPGRFSVREIIQHFITANGSVEIVARNRSFSYYYDGFHGDMEVRNKAEWQSKYNFWPDKMYPKFTCLPIFKRNGFVGKIDGVSPTQIFLKIITDHMSETLLKSNQIGLLAGRVGSKHSEVEKYWNSVKICIRANYIVKPEDVITWLDYLSLLSYFNKDLRSHKYVCPADLKQSHNRLVAKKAEREKRLKFEAQRKKLDKEEPLYIQAKNAYFGLVFGQGNLTIKVIESVKEFLEVGLLLKHCVYTNEYYKKADSLVFSACIDGVPVETIELYLPEMKIMQSRGMLNQPTKHNDIIKDLLKRSIVAIKKIYNGTNAQAA